MRRLSFPRNKRNPVTLDAAAPDTPSPNEEPRDVNPTNAEIVATTNAYRDALPQLLDRDIRSTRDFFLREVTPKILAVRNGIQDALDVIRLVAEEEPQAQDYVNLLNGLARDAMYLKLARHVAMLAKLNAVEFSLLLKSSLHMDVSPELLRSMLVDDLATEKVNVSVDKVSRQNRKASEDTLFTRMTEDLPTKKVDTEKALAKSIKAATKKTKTTKKAKNGNNR